MLAAGKAAGGCAIGLLLADQLSKKTRQNVALSLLAVGAAAATPFIIACFLKKINLPESDRGMRRRLRSIREDTGFHDEGEGF